MDKMREDFEKWARINLKCDLSHNGEHYNHSNAYHAWSGWEASRKALVVELPYVAFFNDTNDSPALCYRVAEIEKALDAAGVAYK